MSRNAAEDDVVALQKCHHSFVVASIISLVVSGIIVLMFLLARRGLPSQVPQLACAFVALLLLMLAIRAAIFRPILGLTIDESVLIAAATVFACFVLPIWLPPAIAGVFALLCFAGLIALQPKFPPMPRKILVGLGLSGVVSGLAIFMWVNANAYADVWAVESVLLGEGRLDTLFHAAVAAMIKNFGVVSTGASGLVPISYYPGSHYVVAGLSASAGVLPLFAYPAAQQVLFLPSFVFSVAYAASRLVTSASLVAAAMAASVALAGVLCSTMIVWDSVLVSESYTLSTTILLLGIPVIFSPIVEECRGLAARTIAWLITLAFLVLILIPIKASAGVVAIALVAPVLLLLLFRNKPWSAVFLAVSLLLFAILVLDSLGSAPTNSLLSVKVFSFLLNYPSEFYGTLFILLAGVCAIAVLTRVRSGSPDLATSLTITAILCFAPGLLFDLPGGGASYFHNPALLVVAVVFAARYADVFAEDWYVLATATASIFILAALVSDVRPLARAKDLVARAKALRTVGLNVNYQLRSASQDPKNTRSLWLLDVGHVFSAFTPENELALESGVVGQIREQVARLALHQRALVYIPPTVESFWKLHPRCDAVPFLLPAIVGLPNLLGLPSVKLGCELRYYGYEAYKPESHSRALSARDMCNLAKSQNFDAVIVFDGTRASLQCSLR